MQKSTFQSPRAHILLVEKNRGALELLEAMLCWRGYRVTTAVDGRDGLEKFRHGHFQLILTNLSTPSISGWELGRIVKKSEFQSKIRINSDRFQFLIELAQKNNKNHRILKKFNWIIL